MTTECGPTPAHSDVLVRNAYVVTMDSQRRVYPSGAVAITGATIAAVGPDRDVAPAFTATRTISTRGALVHPGIYLAQVTAKTGRGDFELTRPFYVAY